MRKIIDAIGDALDWVVTALIKVIGWTSFIIIIIGVDIWLLAKEKFKRNEENED